MDFTLTPEQEKLQKTAHDFAAQEIRPSPQRSTKNPTR